MTALKISGHLIPAPDAYNIGYETIGSFERNANGNMIADIVAVKTAISLGWQMLNDTDFKLILQHSKPFFADIEYYDPQDGKRVHKQMYTQPGGAKVALDASGRLWWRDVRCVLIER